MALNLPDFNDINEIYPTEVALVFGYLREKQKSLLPLPKENIYYNIPMQIKKLISLFYVERERWDRFVLICIIYL